MDVQGVSEFIANMRIPATAQVAISTDSCWSKEFLDSDGAGYEVAMHVGAATADVRSNGKGKFVGETTGRYAPVSSRPGDKLLTGCD